MRLKCIEMALISSPLKSPFATHLETVAERESIIITVKDEEGRTGYGEAVPFSSPWYTEETIKTCWHMLEDFLIPLLTAKKPEHPSELSELWKGIRGNAMAKSGLEQAVWDLYAKQQDVYLGSLFGGVRKEIEAGVVIAASDLKQALSQFEQYSLEGYRRFKVKINKGADKELLGAIRSRHPNAQIMADANSAYALSDAGHLRGLDMFNLLMIEQPLGFDDIAEHAILQKQIKTPICLDESICSFHDAKSALMLGSCQVINIKMSRVGGWTEAKKIHDLCLEAGIPVWCGGMVEFGISRAHNIALATLPGFTIPGDISSSSKYWERDIIKPEISAKNGRIKVPEGTGIGYEINEEILTFLTKGTKKFVC